MPVTVTPDMGGGTNPLVSLLPPPYRIFYEFLKIGGFFKGGGMKEGRPMTPQEQIEQALSQFQQPVAEGGTEGQGEIYNEIVRKVAQLGDQSLIDTVLNAAPDQNARDNAQVLIAQQPVGEGGVTTPNGDGSVTGGGNVTLNNLPQPNASGEYTAAQIGEVKAAIDSGNVSLADVAEKYGTTVANVSGIIAAASNQNPSTDVATGDLTTTDISSGNPNTGNTGVGVLQNTTAGTDTETVNNARIGAEIREAMDNPNLSDTGKKAAIDKISTDNGVSKEVIAGIVGASAAAVIAGYGGGGSGNSNANSGGGETNISNLTTPQIIAGAGSLIGAWLGYKGAGDASDAQSKAAAAALAVFEKNAAASVVRLQDTANTAIKTIQGGAETSRNDIITGNETARSDILAGGNVARGDVISARDKATQTLLDSFGLQKSEITNTALAASGLISAAREKAAGAITAGFSAGIAQIGTSRDIANKILQDSLTSAEEKMDVGRAGAIAAQDRGVAAVRSDFQPYLDAGRLTVENISNLVNNPQAQRDFILSNPFFDALAKKSEDALLKAKASVGKVGTGGTQIELQNEMLAIGNQLLDAAINRSLPLIQGGQNAAAQVAAAERARASAVSQIELSVGQSLAQLVQSTGVNRANVEQNAGNAIADLNVGQGRELAGIETAAGENLASIESTRGTQMANAISNNATQMAGVEIDAGNNLATIATSAGTALGNSANAAGSNLANINSASTAAQANLEAGVGVNEANILTGNAANTADTLLGAGNTTAAGIVGQANALTNGLLNLGTVALNPTQFNNPNRNTNAGAAA